MAAPMDDATGKKDEDFLHPYASDIGEARLWMRKYIQVIRDCIYYKEEHKACKSWSGKFTNYYTYGEQPECEHWQKAYEACKKVKENSDEQALDYVVGHELVRRKFRLEMARNNDVWEYRSEPPEDWSQAVTVDTTSDEKDSSDPATKKDSLTEKAKTEIKKFQDEVLTVTPKVNPKYDDTVQRCTIL